MLLRDTVHPTSQGSHDSPDRDFLKEIWWTVSLKNTVFFLSHVVKTQVIQLLFFGGFDVVKRVQLKIMVQYCDVTEVVTGTMFCS